MCFYHSSVASLHHPLNLDSHPLLQFWGTEHTLEADGETPKKFLGYEFKKDGITYFVGQEGSLMVTKGKKVIVEESGEWVY